MTRARDLANIADGTFTATDLDLSGTLTVSGDATFDTNTLFVDVSTDRVGIGTSSPATPLDVYRSGSGIAARWGKETIYGELRVDGQRIGMQGTRSSDSAGTGVYIENPTSTGTSNFELITFRTTGTERMRIDSSGNVGIGVTSISTQGQLYIGASGTSTDAKIGLSATNSGGGQNPLAQIGSSADGTYGSNLYFTTRDTGGTVSEAMRITSAGNVGIGTSSPVSKLSAQTASITAGSTDFSTIGFASISPIGAANKIATMVAGYDSTAIFGTAIGFAYNGSGYDMMFATNNNLSGNPTERMRIDSSGNVGIGTTSPAQNLDIVDTTNGASLRLRGLSPYLYFDITSGGNSEIYFENGLLFKGGTPASGTERMRIDTSGNLLVGKTSIGSNVVGFQVAADGKIAATVSDDETAILNRTTSDGDIVQFRKDGSTVGSIGTKNGFLYIETGDAGLTFDNTNNRIFPSNNGTASDNILDLGHSSARFVNIYATNGTIQTSDANEKQDVEELSEAERRVAVACKGLLRKFRWISSVEEKGDDARIHFGIIAQDLEAAFEAEGLDAGRYAMFIHSTWTDEETGEERSRMGVRYSELLAFIIAAL